MEPLYQTDTLYVLGRINVESIAQLATSICKDKRSRSRRSYEEK